MKKLFAVIPIFILTLNITFAQFGWYQQTSGTNNRLNMICSNRSAPDYDFLIAGNNGTILKTTNFGLSWIQQQSGTTSNLNSIFFYNSTTGYAVGESGTILKTINGGTNWQILNTGTNLRLNDIKDHYYDPLSNLWNLWVAADSGKLLLSPDFGYTWQILSTPTTANLHCIFVRDSALIMAGSDNGSILRSTNGGGNWILTNTGFGGSINGFVIDYSTYRIYACCSNGKIIYSSYYGGSWYMAYSGTGYSLNGITGNLYGENIYACGDGGLLLRTTSGGNNWTIQSGNTSVNLHSIIFVTSNTGWAVGDNGVIIHTWSDVYAISSRPLNSHTISAGFKSSGEFNADTIHSGYSAAGFEWPKGSGMFARFASGLWLGAIIGTDTIVTANDETNGSLPGYTDNSGIPHGCNSSAYRVYKLSLGSSDSDRQQWPNSLLGNSDQGAPVYFDISSGSWKPFDMGEQTIYSSYTDSYKYLLNNYDTSSLKADVRQLSYVLYFPSLGEDVIISQFTIINRNTLPWHDAYITVHTDDDLGDAVDDVTGCDTTLQMGYTYNGMDFDAVYGAAPPAVCFILLKSASVYTGNSNDTDYICIGRNRNYRTGYKQIGMSAFNNYNINEEALSSAVQYRYCEGLDQFGNQRINPVTGLPTRYIYSGNPETNQGWIQLNLDDQRFLISMGPLNMNPGDTQTVAVAEVVARGTSYKNSVTKLKQYASVIRNNYRNCFSDIPIAVNNNSQTAYKFRLVQNYPNPFNPKTTITYELPISALVNITIFDVLGRKVDELVNTIQNSGIHKTEWDGTNFASGVYFYRISAGEFISIRKMVLIK